MAYPYMGKSRHFHVVFDIRVFDLSLSITKNMTDTYFTEGFLGAED